MIDRKAAVEAANASIETAVKAIKESPEWVAWLDYATAQRKAEHHYSFFNTLWLWAQAQERGFDLGLVGPVKKFWNPKGRSVVKGQKAMSVYKPTFVPLRPNEPGYVAGLKKTKLIGFEIINTAFDVSQTEGDPLPEPVECPVKALPLTGPVDQASFDTLATWSATVSETRKEAFPVRFGQTGRAFGYTDPMVREIVLSTRIEGETHSLKTLIHEVAHSILHTAKDEHYDYQTHRGTAETEAESVAYVVCQVLGIDTSGYSFAYVAGWAPDVKEIRRVAGRIERTANTILDVLSPGEEDTRVPVAASAVAA